MPTSNNFYHHIVLSVEFVNMLLAIFILHMKMNLLGITELSYYVFLFFIFVISFCFVFLMKDLNCI